MSLHEKTAAWWSLLVRFIPRFEQWLQRLYLAEKGGAERFQAIVDRWNLAGDQLATFNGIIMDELRHQDLVAGLLAARGVDLPTEPTPERYWDPVWAGVTTFEEACAAGARGEMLARNRFRVILNHPETPEDVRAIVAQILPDEERHARLLGELAGTGAMLRMRPFHQKGMRALGLIETEDDD
ncbi:MAG: ferritin-like domain-containing protein [Patescibacteria group bacterium]|jgi:hypothetical protein